MDVNGDQFRAARALLGWSQRTFARRAGLGSATVARLEEPFRNGQRTFAATANTVARAIAAFESEGLRFEQDGVVRRREGCATMHAQAGA